MTTTADVAVTPSADSASASAQATEKWTSEQLTHWNKTGEIPKLPSSPDSATGEKDKKDAVADSAPQNDKKAVSASDSAPDTNKDAQPHRKPQGDKRFQELANENKTLRERLEALERKSSPTTDKRESSQASQPAAKVEEYKPLDEKQWFKDNQGKTYEDFVRAAARHEAKWEADQQVKQAMQNLRQEMAQESAKKELQVKLNDATERYGKEEVANIFPALESIVRDEQIPFAVKAMINDSDVVIDLLYTLRGDEAAFADFLKLSKSNPGAAIRQIVTTEALVREQLKSNGKATSKPATDTDQKGTVETKPRTPPKPPAEVGGRGAATEDPATSAARSGNFRAFEAEQRRRITASLRD